MRILLFLIIVSLAMAKTYYFKLENGVRIILRELKDLDVVSLYLGVKSGTFKEEKEGENYFTFSMLTRGTKHYDKYQIAETFEKYGGFIASGSNEDFGYVEFSTRSEGLKEALKVLEDILFNPTFPKKELNLLKREAIASLRSQREEPFRFALLKLRALTYKGTNYAYPTLGTLKSIRSIRREDLIRRYREVLVGSNLVVAVVGKFNVKELLPKLKEIFLKVRKGEFKVQGKEVKVIGSKTLKVKREGSQATVLCAFYIPREKFLEGSVLSSYLGRGMTSLLFKELRERRGYAYAVYTFLPLHLNSLRLYSYIGTEPRKGKEVLKEMLKLIKGFKMKEEDLEVAKRKLIGDYLIANQTRLRQAYHLVFWEIMGFSYKMDEEYERKINSLSLNGVLELRDYLKKHHCVLVSPDGTL